MKKTGRRATRVAELTRDDKVSCSSFFHVIFYHNRTNEPVQPFQPNFSAGLTYVKPEPDEKPAELGSG